MAATPTRRCYSPDAHPFMRCKFGGTARRGRRALYKVAADHCRGRWQSSRPIKPPFATDTPRAKRLTWRKGCLWCKGDGRQSLRSDCPKIPLLGGVAHTAQRGGFPVPRQRSKAPPRPSGTPPWRGKGQSSVRFADITDAPRGQGKAADRLARRKGFLW